MGADSSAAAGGDRTTTGTGGRAPVTDDAAAKRTAERKRVWDEVVATYRLRQTRPSPLQVQWWHWPLAASAIYAMWNGAPWDQLRFRDAQTSREVLHRDWGVTQRDELLFQLHWLMTEGHAAPHAQRIREWSAIPADDLDRAQRGIAQLGRELGDADLPWQFRVVRHDTNAIHSVNLAAFDLLRVMLLARHGVTAGLFTEEEGWDFMLLPSHRIQTQWRDWKSLGRDFKLSRWFWHGAIDDELRQLIRCEAADSTHLTASGAIDGPWRVVPFDLPLPASRLLLVDAWVREAGVEPLDATQRASLADPWARSIDDLVRQRCGLPPSQ